MPGRTTIVVAHRLRTIRHATKIALIRHGEIAEFGSHMELMAIDGAYKHLVKLQELVRESKDVSAAP